MSKIKGITVGTYLTKRMKNTKDKKISKEEICNKCKNKNACKYRNIGKFENGKVFENNVSCDYFYFTITSKAILTLGTDRTTGETIRKTYTGKNEEEAMSKALAEKLEIERNGGFKPVNKSRKSIVQLVKNIIEEDYKLGRIKAVTYKRKLDTLKKIEDQEFANKPISKVTRDDVVDYLESIRHYAQNSIKKIYELLCIAFGQASYEHIIMDNFMEGWKCVEKPKSTYVSHHKIAMTLEEERILANYLYNVEYENCNHKYLLLLLLSTGMRIGEALVLDYEKDIDFENEEIHIRRSQSKDHKGKEIIGDTTKTYTGQRTIKMNEISKQVLEKAMEHIVPNDEHLLFCKEDGTMYVESTINSCVKRIALKLDLGIYEDYNKKGKLVKKTYIHTHMLRGTFATRCAETKMAGIVLKKMLGHKDVGVTNKYYLDVDSDFEKKENKSVEEYLKEKEIFDVYANTIT